MPRLNGGPTPLQSEADTMSQVPSMVGLGAESLPRTVSDGFSPDGSASQPGSLQGSKNAQLLGLMRAGSAESGSPSDTGSKTGVRMSPNDCALFCLVLTHACPICLNEEHAPSQKLAEIQPGSCGLRHRTLLAIRGRSWPSLLQIKRSCGRGRTTSSLI